MDAEKPPHSADDIMVDHNTGMSMREFQERYWSNWSSGQDPYSINLSTMAQAPSSKGGSEVGDTWSECHSDKTDRRSSSSSQGARPRRVKRRDRMKGPHVNASDFVCFLYQYIIYTY
jgi:hypothetical protein